jgi:hypothetical protein
MTGEAVSQQAVDAYVRNNPALERFVAAAIRIGELEIVDEKNDNPVREIPLTQGKVALVDDGDYLELNKHKWRAQKDGGTYYAVRWFDSTNDEKRTLILMHRVILNPPEDMETDHINGNGLDNRRTNLRIVTHRENLQNIHIEKSSKYPGVTWHKKTEKWMARIKINGHHRYLGCFVDELEAANTYNVACKELKNQILEACEENVNGNNQK